MFDRFEIEKILSPSLGPTFWTASRKPATRSLHSPTAASRQPRERKRDTYCRRSVSGCGSACIPNGVIGGWDADGIYGTIVAR